MFILFNQGIMGSEYIQYEFDDDYKIIHSQHTYPNEKLIRITTKRLVRTIYTSYFAKENDMKYHNLKNNHSLLRIVDLISTSRTNEDLFTEEELSELDSIQKTLPALPPDPEMEELDRKRKEAFVKSWKGIKKSDIIPHVVQMPDFKSTFDGDTVIIFDTDAVITDK